MQNSLLILAYIFASNNCDRSGLNYLRAFQVIQD